MISTKVTKHRLLILFVFLFTLNCSAIAQFQNIQVVGLGNISNFKPSNERNGQLNTVLNLTTRVPGIGTLRIKFDHERKVTNERYYTSDSEKETKIKDQVPFIILEGITKHKGKEFPVHGSIFKKNGVDQLFVTLKLPSPKGLYSRTYKLSIPLVRNQENLLSANLRRHTITENFLGTCGEPHKIEASKTEKQNSSSKRTINTSSTKILKIGLHGDQSWYLKYGDTAQAEMASTVTAAGAIYRTELGLDFDVTYQEVLTQKTFGTVAGNLIEYNSMLTDYQSFVRRKNYFSRAKAFHLFSAQEMTDGVLGLAYLSVICRSKSNSVGYTTLFQPNSEITTFAHEMGHNFGADHSEDGGIMHFQILDPLPTSFSSSSINEINTHVNNYGSCLSLEGDEDDNNDDIPDEDEDESDNDVNQGNIDEGETIPIDLTGSIDRSGNAAINIQLEDIYPNCHGKIRAGTNVSKLSHSRIISRFVPDSETITLSGAYVKKAQVRNLETGRPLKYFLLAEITCESDGSSGESDHLKINPQKIANRGHQIPAKKWLKKFGENLTLIN